MNTTLDLNKRSEELSAIRTAVLQNVGMGKVLSKAKKLITSGHIEQAIWLVCLHESYLKELIDEDNQSGVEDDTE